jgi:hypothetical protein
MIEIAITVGVILVIAVFVAMHRARTRRNTTPGDVYPHW